MAAIGASQIPTVMFTRGGLDAPDTRGESMVQKHLDKLQKEKEVAALQKTRAEFPSMSPAVCILALQEAGWNDDHASLLLQRFQEAHGAQLEQLEQRRAELEAAAKHGRSAPAGSAPSSSGSESGSESEEDDSSPRRSRKRSRSDHRKRKSSRLERKSKRSKKSSKDKDKDRENGRSRKRDSKKARRKEEPKGALTEQYGKYGIIHDTDLNAKRAEFQSWAAEHMKVDVELLPKNEEKELFRTYVEDFNTATLPHKKYYNIDAYEVERAAKAAKKGKPVETEKTMFNDEEEVRREVAARRAAEQEERLREAYNELKYTQHGKAADMREQELLRIQMNLAYRTGDHDTASKLAERLKPDEQKDTRDAGAMPNF